MRERMLVFNGVNWVVSLIIYTESSLSNKLDIDKSLFRNTVVTIPGLLEQETYILPQGVRNVFGPHLPFLGPIIKRVL